MLAGMLKVRLPRMPGTFSLGYLFVLMGIADLTFSQALAIGAATTLVQCLWKSHPRPSAAQVLFNVGNVVICVTVCYTLTQSVLHNVVHDNLAAQLGLITCIYFALNTLLVSGIIAMLNAERVSTIWERWLRWSFPYYLLGSVVGGVVIASGRSSGWGSALLILPLMILVYSYYDIYVGRSIANPPTRR